MIFSDIKIKKLKDNASFQIKDDILYLKAHSEELKLETSGPKVIYRTGVSIQLDNHIGLLMANDDIDQKTLILPQAIKILTSSKDEVQVKFKDIATTQGLKYKPGDIIAKVIIIPKVKIPLKGDVCDEGKK